MHARSDAPAIPPRAEGEEWRSVVGGEDYLVSSHGRIWSEKTHRVLRARLKRTGYLDVILFVPEPRTFLVHRLVAEAFIGDGAGQHVNHIDADRTNNAAGNLEWVTPVENREHTRRMGNLPTGPRPHVRNSRRRLSDADIVAIRSSKEDRQDIATRYGIAPPYVNAIRRGAPRPLLGVG